MYQHKMHTLAGVAAWLCAAWLPHTVAALRRKPLGLSAGLMVVAAHRFVTLPLSIWSPKWHEDTVLRRLLRLLPLMEFIVCVSSPVLTPVPLWFDIFAGATNIAVVLFAISRSNTFGELAASHVSGHAALVASLWAASTAGCTYWSAVQRRRGPAQLRRAQGRPLAEPGGAPDIGGNSIAHGLDVSASTVGEITELLERAAEPLSLPCAKEGIHSDSTTNNNNSSGKGGTRSSGTTTTTTSSGNGVQWGERRLGSVAESSGSDGGGDSGRCGIELDVDTGCGRRKTARSPESHVRLPSAPALANGGASRTTSTPRAGIAAQEADAETTTAPSIAAAAAAAAAQEQLRRDARELQELSFPALPATTPPPLDTASRPLPPYTPFRPSLDALVAAKSPGPRAYTPFLRHHVTHVKLQGVDPSMIQPGYQERLRELIHARTGRWLSHVYVRAGCIELVLDCEEWGSGVLTRGSPCSTSDSYGVPCCEGLEVAAEVALCGAEPGLQDGNGCTSGSAADGKDDGGGDFMGAGRRGSNWGGDGSGNGGGRASGSWPSMVRFGKHSNSSTSSSMMNSSVRELGDVEGVCEEQQGQRSAEAGGQGGAGRERRGGQPQPRTLKVPRALLGQQHQQQRSSRGAAYSTSSAPPSAVLLSAVISAPAERPPSLDYPTTCAHCDDSGTPPAHGLPGSCEPGRRRLRSGQQQSQQSHADPVIAAAAEVATLLCDSTIEGVGTWEVVRALQLQPQPLVAGGDGADRGDSCDFSTVGTGISTRAGAGTGLFGSSDGFARQHQAAAVMMSPALLEGRAAAVATAAARSPLGCLLHGRGGGGGDDERWSGSSGGEHSGARPVGGGNGSGGGGGGGGTTAPNGYGSGGGDTSAGGAGVAVSGTTAPRMLFVEGQATTRPLCDSSSCRARGHPRITSLEPRVLMATEPVPTVSTAAATATGRSAGAAGGNGATTAATVRPAGAVGLQPAAGVTCSGEGGVPPQRVQHRQPHSQAASGTTTAATAAVAAGTGTAVVERVEPPLTLKAVVRCKSQLLSGASLELLIRSEGRYLPAVVTCGGQPPPHGGDDAAAGSDVDGRLSYNIELPLTSPSLLPPSSSSLQPPPLLLRPGIMLVDLRVADVPVHAAPVVVVRDAGMAWELRTALATAQLSDDDRDSLLMDLGTWVFHAAAAPQEVSTTRCAGGGGGASAAAGSGQCLTHGSQGALESAVAGAGLPPPATGIMDACDEGGAERLGMLGLHLLRYALAAGWWCTAACLAKELVAMGVKEGLAAELEMLAAAAASTTSPAPAGGSPREPGQVVTADPGAGLGLDGTGAMAGAATAARKSSLECLTGPDSRSTSGAATPECATPPNAAARRPPGPAAGMVGPPRLRSAGPRTSGATEVPSVRCCPSSRTRPPQPPAQSLSLQSSLPVPLQSSHVNDWVPQRPVPPAIQLLPPPRQLRSDCSRDGSAATAPRVHGDSGSCGGAAAAGGGGVCSTSGGTGQVRRRHGAAAPWQGGTHGLATGAVALGSDVQDAHRGHPAPAITSGRTGSGSGSGGGGGGGGGPMSSLLDGETTPSNATFDAAPAAALPLTALGALLVETGVWRLAPAEESAYRAYAGPPIAAQGYVITILDLMSLAALVLRSSGGPAEASSQVTLIACWVSVLEVVMQLRARGRRASGRSGNGVSEATLDWSRIHQVCKILRYVSYVVTKLLCALDIAAMPPGIDSYLTGVAVLVQEGVVHPASCLLSLPLLAFLTWLRLVANAMIVFAVDRRFKGGRMGWGGSVCWAAAISATELLTSAALNVHYRMSYSRWAADKRRQLAPGQELWRTAAAAAGSSYQDRGYAREGWELAEVPCAEKGGVEALQWGHSVALSCGSCPRMIATHHRVGKVTEGD